MPKLNVKYRFEDPNGSLINQTEGTTDVKYDTQHAHEFAAPEHAGYATPAPQKHLVAPGHEPEITFIYREQSAAAITIRYLNQHGKLVAASELDLPKGQKIDPTQDGKVPRGYHLDPGQRKSVTADALPHTVTLKVTGDTRTQAVDLILDLQTPSGHTIENLTHKVAEKLRTGDAYHIDPQNYTPKGYECTSETETGYLGTDGLTKPSITFTYCAMPAAPVTVSYVNQRGKRVGSYTYNGYTHQKITVTDPNHVPGGYHLLDDNPKIVVLQPHVQTVAVNVTGDAESAKISADLVYQLPSGDVVKQLTKQIPVSGRVGDMYEIDPNRWTRSGYHAVSYTVNGYFLPGNQVSSSHAVLKYESGSASLFGVTYVNQKGRLVSSQQIHGYVDQPVNISRAVPVPQGYHLVSGQRLQYTLTLKPQQVRLNVQGEYQTNDFNFVAIIEDPNGKQITHRLKAIPVKASVGDDYTIDPAKYPVDGFVPISDPVTGLVHDHQLSISAHRFIFRPQPVHTEVDYTDARGVVVKRVPVDSYLDMKLDVSDTSDFGKQHMPDGYQYLEVPENPKQLTLEPGMPPVKIRIAPIAPEQARIIRSPFYPHFVIDLGKWKYVRYGSQAYRDLIAGGRLAQHLVFRPIDDVTFADQFKDLLFAGRFKKIWKNAK